MNSNLYKQIIIGHLLEQGYVTYAQRFQSIKFIISDFYEGSYCPTAFMIPDENIICINPGFFTIKDANDESEQKKQLDIISVLIRHELLHFLLSHEKRFISYLKKKFPHSWGRKYADPVMHRIANFAMDYDLCNEAYEPEDKEIIKTLTVNGKYVGGLITEEQVRNNATSIWFDNGAHETFSGSQFNNWQNKSMEDMWQMLNDAHLTYTNQDIKTSHYDDSSIPDPKPEVPTVKGAHTQEYNDMFNKVAAKFGGGKASPAEVKEVIGRILAGEDIDFDNWKFDYSEQLRKAN